MPTIYSGTTAYARAKRAQVVLAEECRGKRLRDDRIAVHAMHPRLGRHAGPRDRTARLPHAARARFPGVLPEEGADTIVWLAAADEPGRVTGKFWLDCAPRSTTKLVPSGASDEERVALWSLCEP